MALEPVMMLEYFNELEDDRGFEDGSDDKEALDIIIDRLRNDENGTVPFDILFTPQKKRLRKKMLDLLSERVPMPIRLDRLGDATLKAWLSSNNVRRAFMFINKPALRQIGAEHAGEDIGALSVNKSIDKLVDLLPNGVVVENNRAPAPPQQQENNNDSDAGQAGGGGGHATGAGAANLPPVTQAMVTGITVAIVSAILERSFMKPLTGEKREHCRNGHKVELPIALDMMRDINTKEKLKGFKIVSLHRVGLIGKKGEPYVKDSIDFIVFVHNETLDDLELWGLEVKSRQADTTINKEKDFFKKLRRPKYMEIPSDQVHKHLHDPGERYQCLHHAYAYEFDRVAHVVANSSGKVISGTIINYNEETRNSYGKVLKKIKEMALDWAYDVEDIAGLKIPDHIVRKSKEIKTINGKETIYGAVKLWLRMFANPSILPYPILQRIIPAYHAQWNATKGGSDTVTKLMDDCFGKPPRIYTNHESTGFARIFSIYCVAILKLMHVTSAGYNIRLKYISMQHYRNAASHRMTYKKVLWKLYKWFGTELATLDRIMNKENGGNQKVALVSPEQRTRRTKAKGFSTVPTMLSSAYAQTFKTPVKAKMKQIEKGNIDVDVLERIKSCTGQIVEVVQQVEGVQNDPRHQCYVCKTNTPWQCQKCHLYFCMKYTASRTRKEQLYYIPVRDPSDPTNRSHNKILGKSCYHSFHEAAIMKEVKELVCVPTSDSD